MTLFDVGAKVQSVQSLQTKMLEGIGDGWKEIFRGADDILYDVADKLYRLAGSETVCPSSGDVFRAFRECKYSTLKVVWVLQDPYHQVMDGVRVADGMAMSCSNTDILQPSLRLVYDEIERTVYPAGKVSRNPDLTHWAQQGVLLLNTALTVKKGSPGSHTEIWRSFTQYLLSKLSSTETIFIFSGNNAKSFSTFVSGTKFYTIHPAAAAYTGGDWDSGNLFNNINDTLRKRGVEQIVW